MKPLTLILRRDREGRWWLSTQFGSQPSRVDRKTVKVPEEMALVLESLTDTALDEGRLFSS